MYFTKELFSFFDMI